MRTFKIIVNDKDGIQKIKIVFQGGGYKDPTKVLWHEYKNGRLTADQISKVGGYTDTNLTYSQSAFDANVVKIQAQVDAKAADDAARVDRRAALRNINDITTLPQMKVVLKKLVREVLDLEQD